MNNAFKKIPTGLFITLVSLVAGIYVFLVVDPVWVEQRTVVQAETDLSGNLFYLQGDQRIPISEIVAYRQSELRQSSLDALDGQPRIAEQWVYEEHVVAGQSQRQYSRIEARYHFGWWSLLPALVAIALCLTTREPLTALFGGVSVGAIMLGKFDLTDQVLIPSMATTSSAAILLLYLWLLGGLLGIWSKTGAAQAFAKYMAAHYIRGPKSAKVVAWLLGIIFFQGGTVSTVLVGTTVRPIADRENVSHEEMSYIVDSTASPIAALIAFNAWPAYVQALIFVPGVAFLATESDRIAFFFSAIPFSFYAIFAVLGTLLVSLNISRFTGKGLRKAMQRARETGQLDASGASPLSAKELQSSQVAEGYTPHVLEFILPLATIILVAVGTFIALGVPKVNWAFALALLLCALIALGKGMSLNNLIDGFGIGLKGVVVASVILMLAVAVGGISKQTGGGLFLVDLLGESIPYWLLPVCLQLLTMLIAFSTGTSWGTYAIAFPLAMPLAWAVAGAHGIEQPQTFMAICFATVLNGSVYGDQCSPISDTTVISAMTTGCDLVDHVKTQLLPATYAAIIAGLLWTLSVLLIYQ